MKDATSSSLGRGLSRLVPFTAVAVLGVYLGTANGAAAGPAPESPPCTTKTFKFKEVEKACKKGGIKAAKAYMKSVVRKAKDAGQDVSCKSCHTSLKTFENKPNAEADFKKLLGK